MKKITRRDMLKLSGMVSAAAVLAACAPAATQAPAPTEAPKAAEPTKAPEATKPPEPTAVPPKKAPVKITLVESWFGVPQYSESIDPVEKAINEKAAAEGGAFEITSMILDNHETKYPVLYASGADFTMAFDAPWYKMTTLRAQGALAPIEDLVEKYGQDLKKEITPKIYGKNFMDGHLYGIPTGYYYGGTGGVIFRDDLLKKYNAAAPTSADGWPSLEPFLDAVAKNEKGMLPFGNVTTQSMVGYNRNRHAWAANAPTKTGVTIIDIEKGYKFADEEENTDMIDAAKLLRSWWEKNYINKTDLTFSGSSQNAQVDYVYPGKAAACVENEPDYKWVDQKKQMQSTSPDASLFGVDMLGEIAGKAKGIGSLVQWNFIVTNVNAPAEQQQAGIEYFNWLTQSQDNMDLWLMGVDGVNYKKEADLTFTEIPGVDAARNYRRMWYVSGISGRYQRQPKDLPASALEALKFFSTESNWIFSQYETFQPDIKALEVYTTKLNAVYDEAVHGLNTGQMTTDEAVAKMKATLDAADRQEYKKVLQAQLDEYIAKNPA